MLTWPNGAQAHMYSAEEPERLRGPNHSHAAVDELCSWQRLDETWQNLEMTLRSGKRPRRVIATTPKPLRLLREIVADPSTVVTRGSTYDNAANLADSYIERVARLYEGTKIGRQELHAEILDEDEGAILRRSWWKAWPEDKPKPNLLYVLQTWDTAYEMKESADYTACTVWGVFENEKRAKYEMILLGRYRDKVQFPELRRVAKDYFDAYNKSQVGPVDRVLIEPKATGKPLVQELRRAGLPVVEFELMRNDRGRELNKTAKVNAASVVLESGSVWYPEGAGWAEDVIAECAYFQPDMTHENDDLVDCCVLAWTFLRRAWWMQSDIDDFRPEGRKHAKPRAAALTDDTIHREPDDFDLDDKRAY